MKETAMVLDPARRQLRELAPLAEALNAASDAFTEELRTIEVELDKLGLGLDVTLLSEPLEKWTEDAASEEDGTVERASYLAYGRTIVGWKILVRTYREWDGGDINRERVLQHELVLVEASRERRIAAAEYIDKLLSEIARESKAKLASLNKVMDRAPAPPGWLNFTHGIDGAGLVHVLKQGGPNGTLCGTRIVATNYTDGHPCPKCIALLREATGKK